MKITRNPDYTGPFWAWLKASAAHGGDANQSLAWIVSDDPKNAAVTLDASGVAFRGWCSLSPHWPSAMPYPLTFDRSRGGTAAIAKGGGPSVTLRVRLDPEMHDDILAAVAADPAIESKSELARRALWEVLPPRRAQLHDEIARLRGWLARLDDPGGPFGVEISKALTGEPVPDGEA